MQRPDISASEVGNHALVAHLQEQIGPSTTGRLALRHHYSKGCLYIYKGRIIHAEAENLQGPEACHAMLAWSGSFIDWKESLVPEMPTMDSSIDVVLLEFLAGHSSEHGEPLRGAGTNEILEVHVLNGSREGELFEIAQPIVSIGADSRCELCLPDPTVSRHHGRLRWAGNKIHFTDSNSRNGSWLNGRAFHSGEIHSGDRLQIGQTLLELHVKLKRPAATDRRRTVKIQKPPTGAGDPKAPPALRWEGDSQNKKKKNRSRTTKNLLHKFLRIDPKAALRSNRTEH